MATNFRFNPAEQLRSDDLTRMFPQDGRIAIDIGARDGHFSRLLAQSFQRVVSLDLTIPRVDVANVQCVSGNVTALEFPDRSFDFVLCAEVLEHVPAATLKLACRELVRVCGDLLLIGVPYRQDIRVGRTTCRSCGKPNPPWGHVNSFDEKNLAALFQGCEIVEVSRVGVGDPPTNWLSATLFDLAGNPFGTYGQDEPCVFCGMPLTAPTERSIANKVVGKLGYWASVPNAWLSRRRAAWIHVLFRRSF